MINSVLYLSRYIGVVEHTGFHGIKMAKNLRTEQKNQASKVSAEWENLFFFPLNKLSYKSVYAFLDAILRTT